ncbi:hypothetical protein [Pseudonocardia alni]|uniref:hypothetical protein n=1 Tax=Pseudonocardia alni TaxID=33907 RepID=UPI0027A2CC73|nr:hypothetical protein PaSha_02035 [Pseudonocardia alni]
MSARRFGRRSLLVGAGAVALVAVGTTDRWLPVGDVAGTPDPAALRARILAGVVPHSGLATATGRLGLPTVAPIGSAARLLSTTTRIRVQVADAGRWRVDELTPVGEVDTYRDGQVERIWDYGADRLTTVSPLAPVRFPRASDLAPADLARRLLGATPDDPVTALPARRVAGRAAAGLRVTPADPDSLAGRIDVVGPRRRRRPPGRGRDRRPGRRGPAPGDGVRGGGRRRAAGRGAGPGAAVVGGAGAGPSRRPDRLAARVGAVPPPDRLAGRDRVELPVSGDVPAAELLPGVGV